MSFSRSKPNSSYISAALTMSSIFPFSVLLNAREIAFFDVLMMINPRVLKAFQFNWDRKLATPANWKQGDGGVMGAPTTVDGSYERDREGAERWYLKKVNQ